MRNFGVPTLAVFRQGETFPDNVPEQYKSLSRDQYLAVFHTLNVWERLYSAHHCNVNLRRVQGAAIPPWARWSGSPWITHESNRFRSETFKRVGFFHVSVAPHLALPPGWHLLADLTDLEQETMRLYGHWVTETTWVPPNFHTDRVWIERKYHESA